MDIEEALNLADDLVCKKTGQHLKPLQKDILRGSLSGQTYSDICKSAVRGYELSYLSRDVANELWKLLTAVLQDEGVLEEGERVGKKNLWQHLERALKQQYWSEQRASGSPGAEKGEATEKVQPYFGADKAGEAPNEPTAWNSSRARSQMVKQPISKVAEFAGAGSAIPNGIVAKRAPERISWGEAPESGVFYGRSEELGTLQQWLASDSRCRLVALLGMGGIGKTTLSVQLAKQIQDKFEHVIWRSLRHAPPLQEVLADLLQFLSCGEEASNLASVSAGISRLMEYLRSRRCLLILDEVEAILRPNQSAGYYLPGCEDYGDLIKRVGQLPHQSCLLLTSRENLADVILLQGETLPVRLLEVRGLKPEDAKGILEAKGFSRTDRKLEELVRLYGGNPAALMIVATTIRELFNGSIPRFLQQSTLVIGDILGHLLNQQFERLSASERDIAYWLAIEGKALSVGDLKAKIGGSATRSELLSALESLRRRSLIEKSLEGSEPLFSLQEDGEPLFSLQPFLVKYVTDRLIDLLCKEIFYAVETQSLNKIGLLKSHPLVKEPEPQAGEIQSRRLLVRVKDKLPAIFTGESSLEERLSALLSVLAGKSPLELGHAGANIRNLLAALKAD